MPNFSEHPGYLFVLATLLPLGSFLLIFLASGMWCIFHRYRGPRLEAAYQLFGGDRPGLIPPLLALAAIGLAFVASLTGFVLFQVEQSHYHHGREDLEAEIKPLERGIAHFQTRLKTASAETRVGIEKDLTAAESSLHKHEKELTAHDKAWQIRRSEAWQGTLFELVRLNPAEARDSERGTSLNIGFHIDSLSALMFVMVTFVATLIHLFSMGYMSEERSEMVEDHHVHGHFHHAVGTDSGDPVHPAHEHYKRRGRFGRFFMYLSLFCFSMLNLLMADNLFQVFVSWELVGICSYLLVGFYFERTSAANAANKAFITNRVGDAGFILGLLIVWAYFGTFHFESIFNRVRGPEKDAHGELVLAGKIVRATPDSEEEPIKGGKVLRVSVPGDEPGSEVVIFPRKRKSDHFHGLGPREQGHHAEGEEEGHESEMTVNSLDNPRPSEHTSMPYWMLVAAGLGIFLGCVGKSAQFPLQVWLPDAMEGPTPVSALIHAATMVAAGVYLVGRCYPLFTPEVLLVIAYTGGITLFVAATIAIVVNDIKKVLAYSTVSQLGYMMLALGIGGWVAGLFHLVTHAFFKALLFLGSGSVIYGCHHEQDMMKMGGLFPKMRITALTMLMGVFAIAGIPLFTGWYSKDAILAQAMGFVYVHRQHMLLFLLPLATAGITTFYMFRMWFLAFTGKPRDHHVYDHAHESPWLMTVPLVLLAIMSVCVAWGWPLWDAKASNLEHTIHHAQPRSVVADFGRVLDEHEILAKPLDQRENHHADRLHDLAGVLALFVVMLGIVFALVTYYYRVLDPSEAKVQFPAVHALLVNKWYFDAVYSVLLVRPVMIVARAFRNFDLHYIDGLIHGVARTTLKIGRGHGRFDNGFIDWLVNLVGNTAYAIGGRFRHAQTGYLRSYVLFLVLAAVGFFILLTYFVAMATAG